MNKVFYFLYLILLCTACTDDRTKLAEASITLNIVTGTTPATQGSPLQLSPELKGLFLPLDKQQPPSEQCAEGHLIDVTLRYLVSNQQTSFKLNQGSKVGADMKKYQAVLNTVTSELKSFKLPEKFLVADTGKIVLAQRWVELADSIASVKDSVMVYFLNKPNDLQRFSWKGKSYPVLSSVLKVRNHINNLICEKNQLNFTLLIDPQASDVAPTPTPATIPAKPATTATKPPVAATTTKPDDKKPAVRVQHKNKEKVGTVTPPIVSSPPPANSPVYITPPSQPVVQQPSAPSTVRPVKVPPTNPETIKRGFEDGKDKIPAAGQKTSGGPK